MEAYKQSTLMPSKKLEITSTPRKTDSLFLHLVTDSRQKLTHAQRTVFTAVFLIVAQKKRKIEGTGKSELWQDHTLEYETMKKISEIYTNLHR